MDTIFEFVYFIPLMEWFFFFSFFFLFHFLVFCRLSADFFFDIFLGLACVLCCVFLTYHGALTIVLNIFDCSLCDSLLLPPIMAFCASKFAFVIVLYISHSSSMLNLKFRLVNQYICIYFIRIVVSFLSIRIFSTINLLCCFHVNCVSK